MRRKSVVPERAEPTSKNMATADSACRRRSPGAVSQVTEVSKMLLDSGFFLARHTRIRHDAARLDTGDVVVQLANDVRFGTCMVATLVRMSSVVQSVQRP